MVEIVRLKAPGGAEQLELAQAELSPPSADETLYSDFSLPKINSRALEASSAGRSGIGNAL